MTMSLSSLQISAGEVNFQSEGFRNNIEDHLEYLKANTTTETIPVSGLQEIKYQGDFYGLLSDLKVNQDIHWITMRVNDMHSPVEFSGGMDVIKLPSRITLKKLLGRYLNSVTIV